MHVVYLVSGQKNELEQCHDQNNNELTQVVIDIME
jgi:hypothetical protein